MTNTKPSQSVHTVKQACALAAAALRQEGIRAVARRMKKGPGSVHNAIEHLEAGGGWAETRMLIQYLNAAGFELVAVKSS